MAENSSNAVILEHLTPELGVEKILETKLVTNANKQERFYKVHWSCTWESEQSLTKYCSSLIDAFWNEKKGKQQSKTCGSPVSSDCTVSRKEPDDLSVPAVDTSSCSKENEDMKCVIFYQSPHSEESEDMKLAESSTATALTTKAAASCDGDKGSSVVVNPVMEKPTTTVGARGKKKQASPKKFIKKTKISERLREEISPILEDVVEEGCGRDDSDWHDESDASSLPQQSDDDYMPDEEEPSSPEIPLKKKPTPQKKEKKKCEKKKCEKKKYEKKSVRGLTKCEKCGTEHKMLSCPGCRKKVCETCGSRYMFKCRKCSSTCPQCGKVCWKPNKLKEHIEVIHERVKKHSCKICSKLFTSRVYLKSHMETHKDKNDYICEVCNKTFKTKRVFWRHKKIHMGIKLYQCTICSKEFQENDALKTHMRLHSNGPRRFQCLLCKKGFNHKVSLKSHMSKHHDKNEQQAAVMLGLWKKYQNEEISNESTDLTGDFLTRALNAVAMNPNDAVDTSNNVDDNHDDNTQSPSQTNLPEYFTYVGLADSL